MIAERLRRVPAPVLAFLLALVVYGAALYVMQPASTGDEPHYALEALSIARDGDRDLRNDYLDPARVAAVTNLAALDAHAADFGTGRLVSAHGVGLPLILAPVAAVTDDLLWMRVVMVLVAALAAALLLRLVLRVDAGWRGWLAWALVAFSLPLVGYATQLYPETVAALCVLVALNALVDGPRSRLLWVMGAFAAGALPWLHGRYIPVLVGLAVAFALRALWGRRQGRVEAVALAGAPIVLSLAVLAVAFNAWYGSPMPTAVFGLEDSTATVVANASATPAPSEPGDVVAAGAAAPAPVEQEGPVDYLLKLLRTPTGNGVYTSTVANFLSPGTGWLPFAPVHVLALAGLAALAIVRWRWAAVGLLVAAGYLALLLGTAIESRFAYPARYLVVLIPLVAIPLAVVLRARWTWPLVAVAGALTAAITAAGVLYPGALLAASGAASVNVPVVRDTADPWPVTPADTGRVASYEPEVRERAGVSRSVTLQSGAYTTAFEVLADGTPSPGSSADLEIVAQDGGTTARQTVSAEQVGARRVFKVPLQVVGPAPVRLRLTSHPRDAFRLSAVQIVGTEYATTDPPAYYDWRKALGWGLVIAALAAALAYSLWSSSRRERQSANTTAAGTPATSSASSSATENEPMKGGSNAAT